MFLLKTPYFQFIKIINSVYALLGAAPKSGKGRPLKYPDQQIIACMLYQVIFSFRELEWRIQQDIVFQRIIGFRDTPDFSTFCLRVKRLEKSIYFGLFNMLVHMIDPSFRICAVDGTALRSSRYDSEAGYGHGTRLGSFKGYKLHLMASVDDFILPLAFEMTLANRYDNGLFIKSHIGKNRYERHIRWVLLSYLINEYSKKLEETYLRKYPWNR